MARITGKSTQETMDLKEKRLGNANPVQTAEKLDGQDF